MSQNVQLKYVLVLIYKQIFVYFINLEFTIYPIHLFFKIYLQVISN